FSRVLFRSDLAQVLLAVDLRQDLPFLGPEVEDRPVPVTQRRQHRDRMDAGDARLQPRPFVNAPRTLHQQRIDPNLNADPVPLRSVPLLEAEPALRPAHDLVQRLLDLEAQVAPHLLLRHTPHLHENVAEALARVPALQLERAFQLALRDLAGTQQELPQRSPRVPLLAEDDLALLEVDFRLVARLLRCDGQDPGLPRELQELEYVLDAHLL